MSDNDLRDWDAAYVLGALSTEDRLAYEEYLATNPTRAVELSEFAALPGILNALTVEEALALDAPAEERVRQTDTLDLMPSLTRAAAKRQKRSRRTVIALIGATAAAFLAIGIVATLVFGMARTPSTIASPPLQAMTTTDNAGITAQLAVSEKRWGTRLDWKCQYTKAWSLNVPGYDLVVTTEDGKQTPVATWVPGKDDKEATSLAAATGIPTSRIRSVDIRVSGTPTPLAVTTVH